MNNNHHKSNRLIGLTGGIATGKTTVSDYLTKTYKLPIFDADVYAREVVEKGSPILDQLYDRYGAKIRLEDGSLNRPELGKIIFNNTEERKWVEAQIHPAVRDRFLEAIAQLEPDATAVLAIPLLFEANLTHLPSEIWVVSCSAELQRDRLQQRDGLSEKEAQARINSQLPLAEKCDRADVVLDNCGDLSQLYEQVDRAVRSRIAQNH
jgi:dephospho-CoA kinase